LNYGAQVGVVGLGEEDQRVLIVALVAAAVAALMLNTYLKQATLHLP